MGSRFLIKSSKGERERNIFADKSSLIIDWLLHLANTRKGFSIREVAKELGISVGLVQGVFESLVQKGLMQVEGIRTTKKFHFKKSKLLLEDWLNFYNITKKCRLRTYRSALPSKIELVKALKQSNLSKKVALALHSAADAYGYKNTNLNTLELYILDSSIRTKLENELQLEQQERGYEVLLIDPYYKAILRQGMNKSKGVGISPVLLTFLDLYHFPLRGLEQAEFMAERIPELKHIYHG